jgi:hypothetical protein
MIPHDSTPPLTTSHQTIQAYSRKRGQNEKQKREYNLKGGG